MLGFISREQLTRIDGGGGGASISGHTRSRKEINPHSAKNRLCPCQTTSLFTPTSRGFFLGVCDQALMEQVRAEWSVRYIYLHSFNIQF